MDILILNGPNLNLLGKREPEIYGHVSFEQYLTTLQSRFPQHRLTYRQSNPGAYAHTSIALADCIRAISIPVVEVHISDISKREPYRRHSYTAEACQACFSGFGMESYDKAIESLG